MLFPLERAACDSEAHVEMMRCGLTLTHVQEWNSTTVLLDDPWARHQTPSITVAEHKRSDSHWEVCGRCSLETFFPILMGHDTSQDPVR